MSEESLWHRLTRNLHEMDFRSQKSAEHLFKGIIVTVAIISYIVANFLQQFSVCVYSTLAAMVICYIIVVPGQAPWWQKPFPPFKPNAVGKNKKE